MPTGVLTPVVRRGRKRLRPAVALLVVAIAAGTAAAILVRWDDHPRPAHAARKTSVSRPPAPSPSPSPKPVASRPPAAPLLVDPPRVHRALRPRLAARAAIVVDARSGRVLWALHPHRRLAVASTTKIMTAYVALQQLPRDTIVRVSPAVTRVPLVKEGLRAHERVRAWKLFHGLLMFSGNDDALALAIASAGTRRAFVAEMNDQAHEFGLRDTHFSSPSGVIDLDNYSSAWDLAALTRVALRNARFRRVVRTRIAHIPWSPPTFEKVYVNKNPLLGSYPGANGVKTGWTTLAGHCLVASATRHGRTIVAVVLHDGNVAVDARRLLDLGFATPG